MHDSSRPPGGGAGEAVETPSEPAVTTDLGIGDTSLERLAEIWIKLECANPAGSIKDRAAEFALREARRRGELKPGDTIVEASSGNTGIALAFVGRRLGHRVAIFMPEDMSVERRSMLEELEAEIRLTPAADGMGGAMRRCEERRGRPGYHLHGQFANRDHVRCHRLHTGPELIRQLRAAEGAGYRLDALVAAVGTGGTLMGMGQALREAWPDLLLVAVEPDESPVLSGGEPGPHGIQGIGTGFVPELVELGAIDEVVRIHTDEARQGADRIREEFGYCVGLSAGANFLAAERIRERGLEVATVFPDCADRYVSVGLESPETAGVHCPLRVACAHRSRQRTSR